MADQHWTSYRSLFRFAGVMYRLGSDLQLPVPLRIESAVVFAFLFALLYVPCWALEPVFVKLLGVGRWVVDFAASAALAHFFSNFDPAGKFLPVYVWDVMAFYLGPKKHRVGAEYRPDKGKREGCEVFVLD